MAVVVEICRCLHSSTCPKTSCAVELKLYQKHRNRSSHRLSLSLHIRHSRQYSASQFVQDHPFRSGKEKTHYETLNVPRNASRMDLKASYFRLSKSYHPDVNSQPGAKEIFHAVSEAYTVLSDDRKRRKYDQSLLLQSHSPRTHFDSAAAEISRKARSQKAGYEGRKRGATHAWPGVHQHSTGLGANPESPSHGPESRPRRSSPFSSPYVRRATGFSDGSDSLGPSTHARSSSRPRKVDVDAEMERQRYDRVSSESNLFRAVRVVALLVAMTGIGSILGGAKA